MIECIEKNRNQLRNSQISRLVSFDTVCQPQQIQALARQQQTANSNKQHQQQLMQLQQQPNNELIGYYFGSISRETAEWILRNHAEKDGAYLLRSSGPNDDFVLSLMVMPNGTRSLVPNANGINHSNSEVLHYKIVETEDSFVALHGQVGDEKFSTIEELIDKARGVATKPRWPVLRHSLEHQILPPTYWGLSVDQVRLAILLKAKQWGFPLISSLFQQQQRQQPPSEQQPEQAKLHQNSFDTVDMSTGNINTLNNETIRTLIYKSLHEFQPWFHGRISRDDAEQRIEEGNPRDGRFLVRERDNYSYAMCISHRSTAKHYRIDVLPTGELAIQDGRKFTSLMALVSHYTIMSDGLWCALTEACVRPSSLHDPSSTMMNANTGANFVDISQQFPVLQASLSHHSCTDCHLNQNIYGSSSSSRNNQAECSKKAHQSNSAKANQSLLCHAHNGLGVASIKMPIKEWLQSINNKWTQLMSSKSQHQSLNSFLFGNQNPLNNHCRHRNREHNQRRHKNHHNHQPLGQINYPFPQHVLQHKCDVQNTTTEMKRFKSRPKQSSDNKQLEQRLLPANFYHHGGSRLPLQLDQNTLNINFQKKSSTGQFAPAGIIGPQAQSVFGLNNQNFVGPPLFSVENLDRPVSDVTLKGRDQANGHSNSHNGSNYVVEEQKLISPAQSVSAALNTVTNEGNSNANPYNLNNNIYGSQTSTATVNDRQGHSSTSSSSGPNGLMNPSANLMDPAHRAVHQLIHQHPVQSAYTNPSSDLTSATQIGKPIREPRILCGQHAGSAYRYTNYPNDENSLRLCSHNLPNNVISSYRSADDSQLPMTKSFGPGAMSKFIQFQDGQCLRTHRDAKSIQMAYLSALQALNHSALEQRRLANQMPLSELRNNSQRTSNQAQFHPSEAIRQSATLSGANQADISMNADNSAPSKLVQNPWLQQDGLKASNERMNASIQQPEAEIDLIDCNVEGFEFKYDPKLIKSSSIETLCSIGENEPTENLSNFKTNAELMMSLQSCWFAKEQYSNHKILNPVPASQCESLLNSCVPQVSQQMYQKGQFHNIGQPEQSSNQPDVALVGLSGEDRNRQEFLDQMEKKHDLDELTTALLAELTASLKAQVDLKNKRAGITSEKPSDRAAPGQTHDRRVASAFPEQNPYNSGLDPMELINEFDTLAKSAHQQ